MRLLSCAGILIWFASSALATPPGRVVILGFDGVDPELAQEMMDKGELPNLAQLAKTGSFQPLGSSNPPQSPTAWSSFATCMSPLNHGIYDFLKRNPSNYIPAPGFGTTLRAELNADGSLKTPPRYESFRNGDSFWKMASDQGLKVKALVVPFAYPAEDLGAECRQLCGLDAPDIRGTQSTYFAFSDAFTQAETPVAGGVRMKLNFVDKVAKVEVPGIGIPGTRPLQYAKVPMTVAVDRAAREVTITIQGAPFTLKEGAWSGWQEWDFALSAQYHVKAISRFHCTEAGDVVRLYMTCLQMHPRDQMIAVTTPRSYGAELADRYGLFKTIGWYYDTKALQQGDLREEQFIEDLHRSTDWKAQLCYDEIDAGNFDLLISAWTSTDRAAHMFWGYRDPKHPVYTPEKAAKYGRVVEEMYKKMDGIVGNVMKKLKPEDLLMVMSDHGFHSFRTSFSVNTWLIQQGYLATKSGQPYTSDNERYLMGIDWSKTKAYGLGLGMVFLNLRGREAQGTVEPAEAPALIAEIREKLLALTDPATGEKVFTAVYVHVNPQGAAVGDAPDLQLGYAEGYQTNKVSAAGGAPKELFEPNNDKWSGEHASSDMATTKGILFSNKPLETDPKLEDLGVTTLKYLGLSVPSHLEGKPLL
jgi:predicted AlkP superfamily phosphohydrolase/phosphomutase